MTFAQRSFVVIYLKVTVLKNSSVINSLDVSSPASKRVLRVNLFQAVRMDRGNWEPLMSCSNQFQLLACGPPIKTHRFSSASTLTWSPCPGLSPRFSSALHTPSRWPAPTPPSCYSARGLWTPPAPLGYTRPAP